MADNIPEGWSGGPIGYATFNPVIINTENGSALRLDYTFPIGSGISNYNESALVRPFHKILKDGKHPGTITYLFHEDNDEYYVLGSITNTNKRILFFPGLKDRRVHHFYGNYYSTDNDAIHLDHLTLEKNLFDWHVTLSEKKERKIKFKKLKTKKVDDTNFLWFVLRIKSLNFIEKSPKTQQFFLHSSLKEIQRRLPIIDDARKRAVFHATLLKDHVDEDFFWQFEFFVSTTQDKENMRISPSPIKRTNSEIIKDTRKKIMRRTHQILLDGFPGSIIVIVSKIIGNMTIPVTIISGHEIPTMKKD